MKQISNTEYQELRNKLWPELCAAGLMDDSNDGEYEAFDKILGLQLNVDWDWYEDKGSDICYGCGTAQNYKTMKDIDETFAIYCDPCHAKQIAKVEIIEDIDELKDCLDANSGRGDWTDDEVSMEMDWLYGKLDKIKKDLEKLK